MSRIPFSEVWLLTIVRKVMMTWLWLEVNSSSRIDSIAISRMA
jgi:hypothetical protein